MAFKMQQSRCCTWRRRQFRAGHPPRHRIKSSPKSSLHEISATRCSSPWDATRIPVSALSPMWGTQPGRHLHQGGGRGIDIRRCLGPAGGGRGGSGRHTFRGRVGRLSQYRGDRWGSRAVRAPGGGGLTCWARPRNTHQWLNSIWIFFSSVRGKKQEIIFIESVDTQNAPIFNISFILETHT